MSNEMYLEAINEMKLKLEQAEKNIQEDEKISRWKIVEMSNIINALEDYNQSVDDIIPSFKSKLDR